MKYLAFILLLFLGLFLCTSCDKENIDLVETEEEEVVPEIIECNLVLDILEEPTGTFTANVEGGTAPYSFLWSTEETTSSIQVNIPGEFSVTVTDAEGCTTEAKIEVSISNNCDDFNISISPEMVTPITPSIDLDIANGTPPYTYEWSNGEITPIIFPSTSDIYSVTVTDANGCMDVASFEFIECGNLDITLNQNANNDSFNVTLVGGAAPYTYQWSHGFTSSPVTFPESGSYSITVTDANGCMYVEALEILLPCDDLEVNLDPNLQPNTLGIIVTGGSGNYAYQWSDGMQGNPIANLVNGMYTVTVTDLDNGCTEDLNMAYYLSDNCSNFAVKLVESSPGTLELNACSGEPPYSFSWNNGQTSQVLTNLASGLYIITITDSNGCSVLVDYVVDLQEQCDGFGTEIIQDADGTLSTVTSGGTEPFSYLWSSGETGSTITPNSFGTYSVTITDAIGCVTTDTIQL